MKKWGFLLFLGACAFLTPLHLKAQEPWARIEAEPNPCHMRPGREECTTFVRWETGGVRRVKVFVTAEGRHKFVEREFGRTLVCETHRCRAPWINLETRYTFTVVDFSRGDRGRVLATTTVTAVP